MPNVSISPPAKFSSQALTGVPLVGGKLYTYLAGTSTPQATYTDYTGGVANANPVILDSRGEADVWLEQGIAYKFILTDASDVPIYTVDGINFSAGSGQTFLAADGSVSAPAYAFVNSTGMGLYRVANNVLGIATAGVLAVRIDASQNVGIGGTATTKLDVFGTAKFRGATTITTGGLTVDAGGVTITAGGLTVTAGGAAISGTTTIAGQTTISGGVFASRGFADNSASAAWNIDSSGRLLNNGNAQTSFRATLSGNQTAVGVTVFDSTAGAGGHNRGSAYNAATGVFTAPVAGLYQFDVTASAANSSGGFQQHTWALQINGSDAQVASFGLGPTTGGMANISGTFLLAANDLVRVNCTTASATMYVQAGASFSGRLVC